MMQGCGQHPTLGPVEHGANTYFSRVAIFKMAEQKIQPHPGIDKIFYQNYLATRYVHFDVSRKAHPPAIASKPTKGQKLKLYGHINGTHQIGHKRQTAF
jgi:hypothetical protein